MEELLEDEDEPLGVVDVSATSGALPQPLGAADVSATSGALPGPLGVEDVSTTSGALPQPLGVARSSSKLRAIPLHHRLVSHYSLKVTLRISVLFPQR